MTGFSAEEIKLISSLFARCGFFVSHSENTDPEENSEKIELKALRKSLKRVAEKSPDFTVSDCARIALENLNPYLNEAEDVLSNDIKKAVSFFVRNKDDFGLLQFQRAIMYVGKSVARAYREELDHHEDEFMLETILKKITGHLNAESEPEDYKDQNISPAEDKALTFILDALKHRKHDNTEIT